MEGRKAQIESWHFLGSAVLDSMMGMYLCIMDLTQKVNIFMTTLHVNQKIDVLDLKFQYQLNWPTDLEGHS